MALTLHFSNPIKELYFSNLHQTKIRLKLWFHLFIIRPKYRKLLSYFCIFTINCKPYPTKDHVINHGPLNPELKPQVMCDGTVESSSSNEANFLNSFPTTCLDCSYAPHLHLNLLHLEEENFTNHKNKWWFILI